jgi:hypothetical protein
VHVVGAGDLDDLGGHDPDGGDDRVVGRLRPCDAVRGRRNPSPAVDRSAAASARASRPRPNAVVVRAAMAVRSESTGWPPRFDRAVAARVEPGAAARRVDRRAAAHHRRQPGRPRCRRPARTWTTTQSRCQLVRRHQGRRAQAGVAVCCALLGLLLVPGVRVGCPAVVGHGSGDERRGGDRRVIVARRGRGCRGVAGQGG